MLAGERPSIVLVGDDAPAVEDATDAIRRKAKTLRNQIGPHLPTRAQRHPDPEPGSQDPNPACVAEPAP